jgi:hypothetical protein
VTDETPDEAPAQPPAAQEVKLQGLQLPLTQQDFNFTSDWIAHFEAQDAPLIAGVDANLFRSQPGQHGQPGGEEETRLA